MPNRDRLIDRTYIPRTTRIYDKTGTTAKCSGDMGILSAVKKNGRRHNYIVVGVLDRKTRKRNFGNARGNIIRRVSEIVYSHLKKQYNFK